MEPRARGEGTLKYGQAQLDNSDEMDVAADRARYERDRAQGRAPGGPRRHRRGAERAPARRAALPGPLGAAVAAKPGYPTVIVPFGTVPNAPPRGFAAASTPGRRPFGVSFTGGACSEPRLIELAYAFEQATKRRRPPPLD